MQSAHNRELELCSLQALHDLDVLDSEPEAEFEALARVAAAVCGKPIALISLIDTERQWFKANLGLTGVTQTPRDISFCGHAVLGNKVFEVPDASTDTRFTDNLLVTGQPHIRHYAGAPVTLRDGLCVGTICVMAPVPGRLDEDQKQALQHLATAVARALEGRHAIRTALKSAAASGLTDRYPGKDAWRVRTLVAELARQHELLRSTLGTISDAVLTSDAQANVIWLNARAEKLTGWTLTQAHGQPAATVFQTVDEEGRAQPAFPLLNGSRNEATAPARLSTLLARDGQAHLIESSSKALRDEAGELLGVVQVFRNVRVPNRASGETALQSARDPLTGLPNRAEFERLLQMSWQATEQDGVVHALLFIDLDQFRVVNDACGHAAGDAVLRDVAQLLAGVVRTADAVARIGGDEFAVILKHCDLARALAVAKAIFDRLEDYRFTHALQRFRIGASIGLVPVDRRWASTALILQAAESSCFAAAEAGGNRVHAWHDADAVLDLRRGEMKWATRIEQALDEDRFVLFAQRIEPVGKPSAGLHAEVLIRLVDRDGALIAPGAFLPAAERYRLATRIDRWVLRRAISWLKALPPLTIVENLSVNLSGQSVGDPSFQAWALDTLAEAGSAVCRTLCLEITETAAVSGMLVAAGFIAKVRALGLRVALDDFGAGASSFGYLKHFQIDYLKIDGQFIRDLHTDPLNDAAVRCFADVARVIGVKTVAEFVDQPAVLARLGEIGVDFAQGYLLHKPVPLDSLLTAEGDAAPVADNPLSPSRLLTTFPAQARPLLESLR